MRVLGVITGTQDLKWALVEGTRVSPILLPIEKKTQKLPVDGDETRQLYDLKMLVEGIIHEKKILKICILQVGVGMYKDPATGTMKTQSPSPYRAKVECVLQLAGADTDIAVELITSQKLRARERKFNSITGNTPEAILNNAIDFKPKAWRDAVLVAWVGLAH